MFNWIKKLFKRNKKYPPRISYVEQTYATYTAKIEITLSDKSIIYKDYEGTVEHSCNDPIENYVDNIFKQGYFKFTQGFDVRFINASEIQQIKYNPVINTVTVKQEYVKK